MASPRVVRVVFDVPTRPIDNAADAWGDVARGIGMSEREAKSLSAEFKSQGGIINDLRAKEQRLRAERDKSHDPKRIRELNSELAETTEQLEEMTGATKAQGSAMSSLFKFVVPTAIIGSVVALGKAAVESAIEYEQLSVSFETFLGSADAAKTVLADLEEFSLATPFTPDEVNAAGRSLIAFGEPVEQLKATLSAIGDVAAGTGKDFNELATIYGKARTAGVLMAEDINQLTEAGVPIIDEFAKIMGVSASEVKKLASEGKVTFPLLEEGFKNMTSEGGRFSGLMGKLSKTTGGLLSTVQGQLSTIRREFGNKLLPIISRVLNFFIDTRSEGEKLYESVRDSVSDFNQQESAVNTLLSRYDELKAETELNEEQQAELKDVIAQLADQVPEAATEFDKYGNALDINTGKVKENLESQRDILQLRSKEAIMELEKEVRAMADTYGILTSAQNVGVAAIDKHSLRIKDGQVVMDELTKTTARMAFELQDTNKEFQDTDALKHQADAIKLLSANMSDLLIKGEELGRDLTDREKEFIMGATGIDKFGDAAQDAKDKLNGLPPKDSIRTIESMKKALDGMKKELNKLAVGSDEYRKKAMEVKSAQEALDRVLGKGKAKAAADSIDGMTKAVSRLQKELKETAVDTEAYFVKSQQLERAQSRLAAATSKLARGTDVQGVKIKELTADTVKLTEAQRSAKKASTDFFDPTEATEFGKRSAQTFKQILEGLENYDDQELQTLAEKLGLDPETLGAIVDATSGLFDSLKDLQLGRDEAALRLIDEERDAAIDAIDQEQAAEIAAIDAQETAARDAIRRRLALETLSKEQRFALQEELRAKEEEFEARRSVLAAARLKEEESFAEKRAELEKEQAERQKSIAIITSIINTAQAVTSALTIAPPAGFILAALVGAKGAAEVATISSQQFAEGGMVEGGIPGKDSVNAWLMPGERVMRVDTVQRYGPLLEDMHNNRLQMMPELNFVAAGKSSADSRLVDEIKSLRKDLKRKKEFHFHGKPFLAALREQNGNTIFSNRKYSI